MLTAMKVCLLLLVVSCAIASASRRAPWTDLRVKYSEKGPSNGYFRLPLSLTEAVGSGWVTPPEEYSHNYQIKCPHKDPTVCVIYGYGGLVHGIEIGVQAANVAHTRYHINRHPTYARKRRFGFDVYVITVYTVKPGTRRSSPRETGDGLWMETGPRGAKMFEVPTQESKMSYTAFVRGGCVPGMGHHYFYNISKNMDCQETEPLVALYRNGELIGFDVIIWGKATFPTTKTVESFPPGAINGPLPDPPTCMVDYGEKYGTISLHVFFVDKPWLISC